MPKVLLIRLNHVPFIDLTGLETFTEALQELKTNHVTILLSEANKRVYQALEKNEIFDLIGEEHYFKDFSSALIYTNHLIPPKRK
jgi:SulP family sulfate permease